MKTLFIILSLIAYSNQENWDKEISKNGMTVSWQYKDARLHFKMTAPTKGWLTIGFNKTQAMTGAYLIMGRVVNGKPEVIEHHTISSGNYKPITQLGGNSAVEDLKGFEDNTQTTLQFSILVEAKNKYARDLKKGTDYIMTLAYSREDDFQHHSIMRTSINVKL